MTYLADQLLTQRIRSATLLFGGLVALIVCAMDAQSAEPTRSPNVLMIVGDDMGYADVGSKVAATFRRRTWTRSPKTACALRRAMSPGRIVPRPERAF
jgi:hypothetical protein